MISELKKNLRNHHDISPEEMRFFLQESIAGTLSEEEKEEILTLQNKKGITASELFSAVSVLQKKGGVLQCVDLCGTGGSGLPRINTSTLAAFVLAALNIPVAKHGNRAQSGRFGSFDLLEKLGITIDLSFGQSQKIFEQEGLSFFFAPKCFPEMVAFGPIRKKIGVPTMFNLLGPLLSPLNPDYQMIGTTNEKNALLLGNAAQKLGRKRVFVVSGDRGLDEVTPSGRTHVWEWNKEGDVIPVCPKPSIKEEKNQSPLFQTLTASDFGLSACSFQEIESSGTEFNISFAQDFLSGKEVDSPHAHLVLMNVSMTLRLLKKEVNMKKGIQMAKEVLQKKEVQKVWERMQEVTRTMVS